MTEISKNIITVPTHLQPYADMYERNPREASIHWFNNASRGLFVHYGLYSLLGRGEWCMFEDRITIDEYSRLSGRFTASNFDPDALAQMAVDAGMGYVNLVVKHHDGFALYDTQVSDFKSTQTPARRDFVAEFSEACNKRGLGLFLYYSYGVDWRHPYSLPRDLYECSRPDYVDQSYYQYRKPNDFAHYIDDMHHQLRELLTQYGPIAGVWFDLISACYFCPDYFPVSETYALIRELQPHALIAFKQGFTGDEDFLAQEVHFVPIAERLRSAGASSNAIEHSDRAWQKILASGSRNEVCRALQKKRWGWIDGVEHLGLGEVATALHEADQNNCNLLLNVGPLPDGSLVPMDQETLLRMSGSEFTDALARAACNTQCKGRDSNEDIPV